ncbi:MAG: HAMP domain-containing histidine kinase [Candidatus Hydrogenedentes bacterium]|nr:HAMP domain-containing histidine kinase [Candidatus Hydrogenedentota bacterium]
MNEAGTGSTTLSPSRFDQAINWWCNVSYQGIRVFVAIGFLLFIVWSGMFTCQPYAASLLVALYAGFQVAAHVARPRVLGSSWPRKAQTGVRAAAYLIDVTWMGLILLSPRIWKFEAGHPDLLYGIYLVMAAIPCVTAALNLPNRRYAFALACWAGVWPLIFTWSQEGRFSLLVAGNFAAPCYYLLILGFLSKQWADQQARADQARKERVDQAGRLTTAVTDFLHAGQALENVAGLVRGLLDAHTCIVVGKQVTVQGTRFPVLSCTVPKDGLVISVKEIVPGEGSIGMTLKTGKERKDNYEAIHIYGILSAMSKEMAAKYSTSNDATASVIVVPVINPNCEHGGSEAVLGAIAAYRFRRHRRDEESLFTDEDLGILRHVADGLSGHFVHAQTTREVQDLEILYEVGEEVEKVIESLDKRQLFDLVCANVQKHSSYYVCAVVWRQDYAYKLVCIRERQGADRDKIENLISSDEFRRALEPVQKDATSEVSLPDFQILCCPVEPASDVHTDTHWLLFFKDKASLDSPFLDQDIHLSSILCRRMWQVLLLQQTRVERDNAQQLAVEHERMATLGLATDRVCHDINNPLYTVVNETGLLWNEEGITEQVRERLELVYKAGQEASQIARNMLDMARASKVLDRLEESNIRTLISDAVQVHLRPDTHERIRVFGDECVAVVDPGKVTLAVANVLKNALDASPPDSYIDCDVHYATESDYAEIVVRDRGCGMTREQIADAFLPYRSDKGALHGLGLTICYDFVRRHRGTVTINSKPGHGTAVVIRLPRNQG